MVAVKGECGLVFEMVLQPTGLAIIPFLSAHRGERLPARFYGKAIERRIAVVARRSRNNDKH